MKIGLNCQYLLRANPAGPERFTINLYKYLARNDDKNSYILYFNAKPSDALITELTGNNPNFSYKVLNSSFLWTQLRLALELLINPVDVFFTPIHTLPVLRNLNTKYIAMIHGLEYKTNEQFESNFFKKMLYGFELWWVAQAATKIVAPSENTKNNIIKHIRTDANKIVAINEGVSDEFYQRSQEQIEPILNKYALNFKKYLLFVSTIQPRKNIVNLVKAFSEIAHDRQDIKLVLVGKLGWNYGEILLAPKSFCVEEKVKFLNWVSQEELPLLFSGALGYTNVSFDEGFGLTVLEAMATEIPVVASNIPTHKEVGAETIKYAEATNTADIAAKLSLMINNKYPANLIGEAKKQAQRFTWNETARKFIELFEA